MLRINGLVAGYGSSQVLYGLDLSVGSGEVVTLMGRNGMGKTTTVRAVMGLVPTWEGIVRFEAEDITRLPPHRTARLGIGLVPEGRQIFPTLTVLENLVATASDRHRRDRPWTADRVFGVFPQLAARRRSLARTLSGGEQQMLAIGRALMTNPKLLILDEATEGLAPLIRQEIWRCLGQLKAEGEAILIIDKDVAALSALADRHVIIEKGRTVWTGDSRTLTDDPTIAARWLGV